MSNLSELSQKIRRLQHTRTRALERLEEAVEDKKKAEAHLLAAQKAQDLIQAVGQTVQQKAHEQIARVVTKSLRTVFEEEAPEFKIHFERKRGKTDARLAFHSEGNEYEPGDGSAGGEADVSSFALQLACVILQQPAPRRLMVLDETFKQLSSRKGHKERVALLLESLAEELKIQLVLVTHAHELECGRVHQLG